MVYADVVTLPYEGLMATDQAEGKRGVPFVPLRSLFTFLDHLHSVGVPNRINKSVFTSSFSGGTASLILRALRDMRTIDDDGKPDRALLEPLVNPDTRSETLKHIMQQPYMYESLIALPVATAPPGDVKAWFDDLGMDAQTARKAQTFFVHAAAETGIQLHKMVADKKRIRSGPAKRRVRTRPKAGDDGVTTPAANTTTAPPAGHSAITVRFKSGGSASLYVNADWIKISRADRDTLNGWIDAMKDYADANPVPESDEAQAST